MSMNTAATDAMKAHGLTDAEPVWDVDANSPAASAAILGYCVRNEEGRYDFVSGHGEVFRKGYKSRGPVTRFARKRAAEAASDEQDEQETGRAAVDPEYSLTVATGERVWSRPGWDGSYEGRAAVLRGHVSEADARAAVERFPVAVRVCGGAVVDGERVPMGVAGVRVRPKETGEQAYEWGGESGAEMIRTGDPYVATFPDRSRVRGTWAEIGWALVEWVIVHRPEDVCTVAEACADGYATQVRIEREFNAAAAQQVTAASAGMSRVRTAALQISAAMETWSPHMAYLSPDDADRVWDMADTGDAAVHSAEAAWDRRPEHFRYTVQERAEEAERAARWLVESARNCGLTVPDVTPAEPPVLADAAPGDPGTVDAWEDEGGTVLGAGLSPAY